jgi:hypothetical protein
MKIQVVLEFESQAEADECMKDYKLAQASRYILSDLRNWLRSDTKHGEGKYTEVYDKLFALASEQEADAWEM